MATPKDEIEDGLASTMDFRVDDAREDQYSENVMGIFRETLTFVNFSTTTQDWLKNVQDSNILADTSLVKTATCVPPIKGLNEGDMDSMDGCEKSRKMIRKLPVTEK